MLEFVKSHRGNRIYLLCAILVSIFLLILFKMFYPYPNLVVDSYVYIRPIVEGRYASTFPIGYTWFLWVFTRVSRSTTLLVWTQYWFFLTAALLFFFTVLFFFRPGKWVKILLFVFLFINPIFIFCSNFIMSDMLFTTLSILWITQLIWIIASPRPYMIFGHALLLFLVFTVRYNALYYPIVASLVLLFVRIEFWLKILAIALPVILIGVFVFYTIDQMKALTGISQFSPFGSWRMANNALYMYGHVCQVKNDPVPYRFRPLDTLVRRYFAAGGWVDNLADPRSGGAFYGGDPNAPLMLYMYQQYGDDSIFLDLRKFGPLAPLYGAYGTYLARKYPLDYCQWFLLPSTFRYIFPPPEIFYTRTPFNIRDDKLGTYARQLFHLKTLTVSNSLIDFRRKLFSPYSDIMGYIHAGFVLGLLTFLFLGGIKKAGQVNMWMIIAIVAFWICDLFFKIAAGAIVLRHQLFLMIIEFTFALLFIDIVYRSNPTSTDTTCYSNAS